MTAEQFVNAPDVTTSANNAEFLRGSNCEFCGRRVHDDDATKFRQITVWVHGPKSDGAVLREDTGRVAHEVCILRVKQGQAVDQPTIV